MNTETALESILFFKGEPVSLADLASILSVGEEEVDTALERLSAQLSGRGIRLVRHDNTVELATAPEAHEIIQTLTKQELTHKLGRAGMETLTIVLYRGPVTRSDIDYIRGVNSSSTLRNLLIRGLVTRREAEKPQRAIVYEPSTELLRHLGITTVSELPEYDNVQQEIHQFYHDTAGTDTNGDTSKTEPNT